MDLAYSAARGLVDVPQQSALQASPDLFLRESQQLDCEELDCSDAVELEQQGLEECVPRPATMEYAFLTSCLISSVVISCTFFFLDMGHQSAIFYRVSNISGTQYVYNCIGWYAYIK
jgi:hypothetical protein